MPLLSRAPGAPFLFALSIAVVSPLRAEHTRDHSTAEQALEPGVERPVSLHAILAFADEHAPALAVARARLQLGEAEVSAASVLLPGNPELELGAGRKVGPAGRGIELEASLSQPFDIAGQRGLRVEAAERGSEVGRLRLRQARWHVHRQVHEAFHNALVARERAAAAERVFAFATHLNEITTRQLEAGEVSQVQVRLAKGELAQARQARVAAQAHNRLARLRLAEVSGWPADRPPRVRGNLDEPRRAPSLEELLATATDHNPRLEVAGGHVAVAAARATLAGREAWPTPTLGVSYGFEREPGATEGLHIGMVTAGIPLPLWDRNQGARARADASLAVAHAEQEAAVATVVAEVVEAHAAVDLAAQRIDAFGSEILPAFAGNLGLLERAFELGEIDLLQVMVARGRFLEIEREALAAYDDYFASVARLEALLGVDIWDDEHHDSEQHARFTP